MPGPQKEVGMPRMYPPEFRPRILDLIASGRKVADVARDLGVSDQTIYNWRKQDLIDRGERPGLRSDELAELQAARWRIAQLEAELAATRRANEPLKVAVPPKGRFTAIAKMTEEGHAVQVGQRALRVVVQVHFENRKTAVPSDELEDLGDRDGLPVPLLLGSLEIHEELLAGLLGHRASAR